MEKIKYITKVFTCKVIIKFLKTKKRNKRNKKRKKKDFKKKRDKNLTIDYVIDSSIIETKVAMGFERLNSDTRIAMFDAELMAENSIGTEVEEEVLLI